MAAIFFAMSLIVTVVVPTGIVMSGDSRTSILANKPVDQAEQRADEQPTPPTEVRPQENADNSQPAPWFQTGLPVSDSTYKVFQLFDRFGVSTCGASFIDGMPIAHHIEAYQASATQLPTTTDILANGLLGYFRAMTPAPKVWFHVAGYDNGEPWAQYVNVFSNSVERGNSATNKYGAWWNGDFEIANRLAGGPSVKMDCSCLNVQDAVDFSRHLVRATIDQMRFELNFPTVGGPIDTLLIKPIKATFLSRKEPKCN